jgi:hypothetical protein
VSDKLVDGIDIGCKLYITCRPTEDSIPLRQFKIS